MKKDNNSFSIENISLGVSSSSTQTEGNLTNSNWTNWYDLGHITDSSNPRIGTKHYELMEKDALLLNNMGIKYFRTSIEWSRIEPKMGEFVKKEMDYYIKEITLLKSYGINLIITLHHFSHPLWFEELGGFSDYNNKTYFLRFVKYVVENLKDLVNEYITINEPNIYSVMGYLTGLFPPGIKNMKKCLEVMSNLASIHILTYELIHEVRLNLGFNDTMVSCANQLIKFVPYNCSPKNIIFTKVYEKLFQGSLTKALYLGKFDRVIRNIDKIKRGKYIDFIAINYYTRSAVKGLNREILLNKPMSDSRWEIFPQGLTTLLKKQYKLIKLPIYITESGVYDKNDSFRSKYIYDHLKEISKSKLPIKRYYYWSFTDNFEWVDGQTPKFGLIDINYSNMERTIKNSGYFYQDIIKNKGVSEEAFNKYVANQMYNYSKKVDKND